MAAVFDRKRAYRADLDVRDWSPLIKMLDEDEPNGVLSPLIAPRRSGKTWALKALEHSMRDKKNRNRGRWFDLRNDWMDFLADETTEILLLDEPGTTFDDDARRTELVERCKALQENDRKVLVAMTPKEWRVLDAATNEASVQSRDCCYLPTLCRSDMGRLARTTEAARWLARVPDAWCRNPFLLEALFQYGDETDAWSKPVEDVLRMAIKAIDSEVGYIRAAFENGLTDGQRSTLRDAVRGAVPHGRNDDLTVLRKCGLISNDDESARLLDPIFAAHLPPPLIIHHVSDVHVGPSSARVADAKETGRQGGRLAEAVAPGFVRDAYVQHLSGLQPHEAPALLVVSGDLVEHGDNDAQLEDALRWLGEVREQLGVHQDIAESAPRVLLVGGNHDVSWSATLFDDPLERHRPFAAAFPAETFPRPALETAPATRSLAVARYPDAGLEFVLLGSAELGGERDCPDGSGWIYDQRKALHRVAFSENGTETVAKLLDDHGTSLDPRVRVVLERAAAQYGASPAATPHPPLKVRDVLAAEFVRMDPGLVHHEELARVKGHGSAVRMMRVAVLHHPVSPMPQIEVSRFSGLINAGAVKEALMASGCSLVLHGHVHTGWFAEERWPGSSHGERTLRVAAAPSLGSREIRTNNGYNEIRVAREGSRYEVHVRRIVVDGTGWSPATGAEMHFKLD